MRFLLLMFVLQTVPSGNGWCSGSRVYSAENLFSVADANPWATKGSAVGQSITIGIARPANRSGSELPTIDSLFISIGYVSYAKPYLYEANSRPKTIRISDLNGGFSTNVRLADTPRIQNITLPLPTTGVKIEVVSIYPGTQWQDTCVNMILPYGVNPQMQGGN